MKFSLSLKYNAVPEWQDSYLSYSQLKKLIYELQAEALELENPENQEESQVSKSRFHQLSKKLKHNVGNAKTNLKSNVDVVKSNMKSNVDVVKSNVKLNVPKLNIFTQRTIELDDLESTSSKAVKSSGDEYTAESLEDPNAFNPSRTFLKKLEEELAKIDEFYQSKEGELYLDYDHLINDLEVAKVHLVDRNHLMDETRSILSHKSSINEAILTAAASFNLDVEKGPTQRIIDYSVNDDDDLHHQHTELDEEEDDDDHSANSALLGHSEVNLKVQKKITLKKRTTQLFVDLSQLKSYIELNRIGFNKITKKFDKSLNTELKATLFETDVFFENSYTFSYSTITNLDSKLDNLVEVYASLTNRLEELDVCKEELRSLLREHIVWERNTVWKDMIGIENKANGGAFGVGNDATAVGVQQLFLLDFYEWRLPFDINLYFTKIQYFKLPKFITTSRTYKLAIIITITGVLLGVKTFNDEAEHRCMALLACVALLWATEAIPLFVTAMLCPLLVVLFRVVKDDDGSVMDAADSSAYILGKMWSSTIMVLLGGFTLAAALSKYNIAKVLASYILSVAGTKPRNILLSIMLVALFLSMWISNVASPVLCYSLIQGVLRTQPTDSPFSQALILGVALSSNIAGMSSPISSPQNIVAMEYLTPYGIGWGQWLGVAIPTSIITVILVWMMLICTFKVHKAKVMQYKPIKEKFTIKQWFIVFVTLLTIILWCVLTKLENVFGESGEIAVIPIVLLFGTGLLSTSDVNNFPWSIVILAMGSLALGKAVSSSGLLATIAGALQKKVIDFSLYVVMVIFGILILVIGTFVSHTVSAIIIIPLVQEVGDSLPGDNSAVILIFSIALLASCGMGLASSGFPNVTAISMTDELGNRYLTVNSFITRGVPASFIAYAMVITIGYGIMVSIA